MRHQIREYDVRTPPTVRFRVPLLLWPLAVMSAVAAGAEKDSGPRENHLAGEKSPYLRQHRLNPVDWYPWGTDAFERARQEHKPIFLSIGYSTCHWCHVMARESFSDPEIARLLNDSFVCIKVDREERPDVDRVYMTFVQALTGGGGWPLSVWLTPDLKPFFGGTYYPPTSRDGLPGFKTVIQRVAGLWSDQHEKVLQQSERMLQMLAAESRESPATGSLVIGAIRERGFQALAASFDQEQGGFERAPKFPLPVMIEFLLDVQATSADPARREAARMMIGKTLRAIVAGGIHDQLGGGFHRYTVDAAWRVPHFEKMLYDQAQLATACLSASQALEDPVLKAAAVDTLHYVQDQLTDADGGFRTAEDADSATVTDGAEHREGAFYVWTAAEIDSVLGASDAAVFRYIYGVRVDGNVPVDPQGEFRGQNILYREHTVAEAAANFKKSGADIDAVLATSARKLLAARAARPRPLRDDKIVTAWNGLAISAFARAAQVLRDPSYRATAERAARFLEQKLYEPATGRLSHRYLGGERDGRGFAEDYAFLIQGLLDLYETSFDTHWLEWAIRLQEKQIELFWDPVAGGFFANAADDTSIVLRLKEDNEAAEPSSNSIAVRNLARLAEMLHRDEWRELAAKTANAFSRQLEQSPAAMGQMLASIGWLEGSPKQVLLQGDSDSAEMGRLVDVVRRHFLPRHVLVMIDEKSRPFFEARVPFVAALPEAEHGPATAYVCENFVCQLPTSDPVMLAKLLENGPAPEACSTVLENR